MCSVTKETKMGTKIVKSFLSKKKYNCEILQDKTI